DPQGGRGAPLRPRPRPGERLRRLREGGGSGEGRVRGVLGPDEARGTRLGANPVEKARFSGQLRAMSLPAVAWSCNGGWLVRCQPPRKSQFLRPAQGSSEVRYAARRPAATPESRNPSVQLRA